MNEDFRANVVNMTLRSGLRWRNFSRIVNLAVLITALVAAVILFPDEGEEVSGAGRISDGDSLVIGSQRIRLLGIDAPELDQVCRNADGRDWPCGRVSRDHLVRLTDARPIVCKGTSRDRYGRLLATCTVAGTDVGAQMVLEGLAISRGDYANEEALARAGKKGVWSGPFITPRAWRDGERNQNPPSGFWGWILSLVGV